MPQYFTGLFAKKQPRATGNKRKKPAAPPLEPGNLEQLRSAGKGGMDPNGAPARSLAVADVGKLGCGQDGTWLLMASAALPTATASLCALPQCALYLYAGLGASKTATEVLWSDPAKAPGLFANESRGVGLIFGPDITKVSLAHAAWPKLNPQACNIPCAQEELRASGAA